MASAEPNFWASYTFPDRVSFSDDDPGLLFSPRWTEPKSAACISSEDINLYQPETEYTLFLTFNEYHIDASESFVRKICSIWNPPASIANWLTFWSHPESVYSESTGTLTCTWYVLTVPGVDSEKFMAGKSLRVCHVLDYESRISRTLVLCSKEIDTEARISRQLYTHLTGNGRTAGTWIWRSWFTVHLVLATVVEYEIAMAHYSQIEAFSNITHAQAARSIDGTFDTKCLKNCNRILALIDDFDDVVRSNKRILEQLRYYSTGRRSRQSAKGHGITHSLQNVVNNLDTTLRRSNVCRRRLINVRHTLLHAIEIRNATYMRQNTIALRRIITQLHAESRYAEKQSELSAKNTVLATRIAILSMIYLPSTFIATVFSTPFLQLNDELQFKALPKIWVYIVCSLVVTLVTLMVFAISVPEWTYRQLFAFHGTPHARPNEVAATSEDSESKSLDESLLEPPPFIAPTEEDIETEIIGILRRRLQTRKSKNEDVTDSSD